VDLAPSLKEMPYPQVIPRPNRHWPGRTAPWPVEGIGPVTIERVRSVMEAEGYRGDPPLGPHIMGPDDLEVGLPAGYRPPTSHSAVLIALFEEDNDVRIILTRRSSKLRNHAHQVAFPGGRLDEGESFLDAALREAHEEVGLDPSLATFLGHLDPLRTASTKFRVQPMVVALQGRPQLQANEAEVERIFDHSFTELLQPGVYHEEFWDRGDLGFPRESEHELHLLPVSFFEVAGDMIWGMTGRLLVQFINLLAGTTMHALPAEIEGLRVRNVLEIDDSV